MSDIAQFISVFRAQSLSDHQRRVTKRNRQAVSCQACRARKLRCDRSQPCGACAKRGDGEGCRFGAASNTPASSGGKTSNSTPVVPAARASSPRRGADQQPRQEVQLRLQKLEDMVQDLVRDGAGPTVGREPRPSCAVSVAAVPTPTDSEPSPASAPPEGDEAHYGPTHWTALLHHIREIQTALEPRNMPPPEPPLGGACSLGPDLLFGAVSPAITIHDVLAGLPPRQDADRLVGVYFGARFSAVPFIHTGRFRREYEAFWQAPESTSFLWISILFSVMASAAIIVKAKGNAAALGLGAPPDEPRDYAGRAVRCLVRGDYLSARSYSVEAALMVAYTRNIASRDLDPVLWNMFGVATRLAQRSGYHLEPSSRGGGGGGGENMPFRRVSPFEAEMRRRAWFFCEAFDVLLSFQLGMPPVIHEADGDAMPPGNYADEDFDEDTRLMPPPRAALDPTPSLYHHWKSGLCRILRRVVRHALSPSPGDDYSRTCALDSELRRWEADLPSCLAARPIREAGLSEPNHVVMHRVVLELMHGKAVCVLHRRYLRRGRGGGGNDAMFEASRRACRAAALRVLELHEEFDREASPGGRLYEDRYMLSSLTLHDFMIAAMVICLDLNEDGDASDDDYERKMNALRTASRIWSARSDCSRDARHAAAVLRAMLQRLERREQTTVSPPPATGLSEMDGNGQGQEGNGVYQGDFDFATLDEALNDPANLDWNLLDQYLSMDRNGQFSMDLSM
ncbi:hypothetical protein CSOJ01_01323 [Colletotrichum sojae]|uniref:Zn(2)-C6 fungal-type domain-containing protein n=1 Tax=Colletotrichum sojae TaxID=2175907 RepID=A0A8H6JUT4_9PEZI|nr:hypothetical protein CSOJ01_01323 [Colletotrichum sojae]